MFDREVVLLTRLNPDQVKSTLESRCQLRANGTRPTAALFKAGTISQDGFQLQLLGNRNNCSKPNLRGAITAREGGSRLAVAIAHEDPFSIVWSAFLVIAALVALVGIRTLADLPIRLSIFAAAVAMLAAYWHLARRLSETGTLTAELALKDVLNATTESGDSKHCNPSPGARLGPD